MADNPTAQPANWLGLITLGGVLAVAFVALPLVGTDYLFEAVLTPFLVLSLTGLGLNLLTGYAGQLSLGTAAFMAVGAYSAFNFNLRLPHLPLLLDLLLAGAIAAVVGVIAGLPSLRVRGFYLIVSTLAAQFFVQWVLTRYGWFSNDAPSGVVDAPSLRIAGYSFDTPLGRYLLVLAVVAGLTALIAALVRSQFGHDLLAVRDNELAARVFGVPVLRTKLLAFALSSFIIGIAGALWAFAYLRTIEPAGFDLERSFQIVFIIVIGGLATVRGAFLGSLLLVLMPIGLSRVGSALFGGHLDSGSVEMSQHVVLGVLILVTLIGEPDGLAAMARRLRVQPRVSGT